MARGATRSKQKEKSGRKTAGQRLWLSRGTHQNYNSNKTPFFFGFSDFTLRPDFSFQDPVKYSM